MWLLLDIYHCWALLVLDDGERRSGTWSFWIVCSVMHKWIHTKRIKLFLLEHLCWRICGVCWWLNPSKWSATIDIIPLFSCIIWEYCFNPNISKYLLSQSNNNVCWWLFRYRLYLIQESDKQPNERPNCWGTCWSIDLCW